MHALLLRQKLKNFLTVSSKFAVMKTTCFSDVLGFNPNIMLDNTKASPLLTAIERQANDSVSYRFQYKIPQSTCFKARDTVTSSKDGSPTFSLSAIIAVFDEFSTLAIVNEDAKTRPGVSTSLHASLTSYGLENIPKEGDTLEFDVSVVKIGKTFGFATAKVYSGDEIVALAKHSKYLESGGAIEKAILGPLLPIAAVLPFPKQQDESTINEERDFLESMVMDDILKFENGNELKIQNEHKNPMGICHVSTEKPQTLVIFQYSSYALIQIGRADSNGFGKVCYIDNLFI